MVVKVVASNDGLTTPQINQDLEVKVAGSSVASNGSPGGVAKSNSVVNGVIGSIVNTGSGSGIDSTQNLNLVSGIIDNISDSNPPNIHVVTAHDLDFVPTSNVTLDGEMQ